MWNCTNDQLQPICDMTVSLISSKILGDRGEFIKNEVKLQEWVIKLIAKMVSRHLKFYQDQVESGQSMGTERLLFVIEDLFKF